jgi:energy-coupling factor transporter ATP-binding protein EcfA2
MSLTCDKRNNTLLGSQLNVLHVMEEGDKVGVFYNFMPMKQNQWKATYDNTMKDLKENAPVFHSKPKAFAIGTLNFVLKFIDLILESIDFGNSNSNIKPLKDLELSKSTKDKRDKDIAKAQIICFSESKNVDREQNNALTLCNSFECLNEDNVLTYKKLKKKGVNLLDTNIKGTDVIRIQPREGQNFISLPARELCEIPAELQKGLICIGMNTYKDTTKRAYLPTEKNERNLALVIIGPNRSGKTTLISNIANDARNGGECTILFDFCGNCELSDSVNKNVKNVLNIDCSDFEHLQGMGYNEVIEDNNNNIFKQYENAKIKAAQLLALIDAVNSEDRELKAKMNKFLNAASLIIFISNGSVKDVFAILQNFRLRCEYIKGIPKNQNDNLSDYVEILKELDDIKNGEVIGTRWNSAIGGINDRVGQLKLNVYMELMLKKDCKNNFNLIDEIQKNQIICFRMPEHMFSTQTDKDAYCTYWMTKIWLAIQLRNTYIPISKHLKVNLIVDELYQVPHCQDFIRSKLSQMARLNCKMIISAHYLNQLKIIKEELTSTNASYMLISGCNKDNYKELKEELEPYTLEDLLHLKKHNSMNLIKLANGYTTFITELPKPL